MFKKWFRLKYDDQEENLNDEKVESPDSLRETEKKIDKEVNEMTATLIDEKNKVDDEKNKVDEEDIIEEKFRNSENEDSYHGVITEEDDQVDFKNIDEMTDEVEEEVFDQYDDEDDIDQDLEDINNIDDFDEDYDSFQSDLDDPDLSSQDPSISQESEDIINEISEEVENNEKKPSLFDRLKTGLFKTRDAFNSAIDNLINGKAEIDDELYDELEEILISADMGVDTTVNTIDQLRDLVAKKHIRDPKLIKGELITLLKEKLRSHNIHNDLKLSDVNQTVILVIGVNGVGKTTSIGKLAYSLQKEGKSVMVAAADTFRAAAIEQLTEWADRVNVEIIKNIEGSDPASIVYDALSAQQAKGIDVLLIDTAGRLHNKKNLMNELEKINRIIDKQAPDALRESLLVLDATTGQNAIYQAKEFNKVTEITGLILTKLDGTAKGGVVFPLQLEHNIPVKYIGIGEKKESLEKFDSDKFVDALF